MTERLHFHFSLSCIGEGNGNPLQGSCLENPREGGIDIAVLYHQSHDVTNVLNSINVWERLFYKSAAHSVIQILVPVHELFVTNR